METFAKLFGNLVVFVYHCFDRMVILGHMPLLTRPERIVHFFRDVHGTYAITKEALRQRTEEYHWCVMRSHATKTSRRRRAAYRQSAGSRTKHGMRQLGLGNEV